MTTEIRYALTDEDVEWMMRWEPRENYPEKPATEVMFEKEKALALLLINDVIFLNSHWWEKEWLEEAQKLTSLNVNCNDVFAWGCADSEEVMYCQLKDLYDLWRRHPGFGHELWCMLQRKEMPQRPVAESIRNAGFDLDAFREEQGLRANHYDGISHVLAWQKYEAYSQWSRSLGQTPLEYDAGWWDGWKKFTSANPGWNDEAWQRREIKAMNDWRVANGYEPRAEEKQP